MTVPDLSTYRGIHVAIRRAPHRMATVVRTLGPGDRRRVTALSCYWKGFSAEVLAHHTGEDRVFFPALVERVGVAGELVERTDADHHLLDELMEATTAAVEQVHEGSAPAPAALPERLDALAALMDEHLDLEDAEILPLFERHFTAEEYSALEDQVIEDLGIGLQAAFTVPFLAAAVTPADWTHILGEAPAPLRVLYRLTRGRHARLDTRALGGATVSEDAHA